MKVVGHPGYAPDISPSQAARISIFLVPAHFGCASENGGLCGHCSRDLPLDRRLLFVAELTGQKWCGVRVMLPTGPNGLRFYRPARVFSELPPHEVGCGTWSCTTIGELMRLLGFSTFPRFEMVDRHGFAPCSPACEASDLLNDRAARFENWSQGRESNPLVFGL